jgi:hypothetical protein
MPPHYRTRVVIIDTKIQERPKMARFSFDTTRFPLVKAAARRLISAIFFI